MLLSFINSNHCWVSFSGFAEAFNEVYEDEIRQYGRCITETDDGLGGKHLLDFSLTGTKWASLVRLCMDQFILFPLPAILPGNTPRDLLFDISYW
jgi:hypothetical protein